MRPIVIATDFSAAADNAMLYGGALASRLNAEVILVNIYTFPIVPASESAALMMPYQEFQDISEQRLKKSERKLLEKFPELKVATKSATGDIADQLNAEMETLDPILLIVGSRERQDSPILLGSSTTEIVKNSAYPVLSVPEHFPPEPPRVAVLATDLQPINAAVQENLKTIVEELGLELHLVHVVRSDRGESHDEVMKSLGSLQADFKTVVSEDLSEGIENYTREISADLVISMPHAHSWLETLFLKRHTKELVTQLHIPLLCIPERS